MGSMGMYSSSTIPDSSMLSDLLLFIGGLLLGGSEVGSGGSVHKHNKVYIHTRSGV